MSPSALPAPEEANISESRVRVVRKILVVVDMQKDFIDGSLGTPEAQAIVGSVIEKMKTYDKSDIYVTRDTHGEDYLETEEGRNLPVVHCVKETAGWQLQPDIEALADVSHIIDKSTFGSLNLMEMLKQENEKETLEIELVGLCTDICVVSNALLLKAAMPENKICVDKTCCAGVTPESHEAALLTMKMCQIETE